MPWARKNFPPVRNQARKLLKGAANLVVERGLQRRTQSLDGGGNEGADAGRDHRVFNGGGPVLIAAEAADRASGSHAKLDHAIHPFLPCRGTDHSSVARCDTSGSSAGGIL